MSPTLRWGVMQRISDTIEGLLYYLITPILLCKTKSPQPLLPLSTAMLSDDEICQLTTSSRNNIDKDTFVIPETGTLYRGHVTQIAPDVVVKHKFAARLKLNELLSAQLVRQYTSIPVPMHDRIFRGGCDNFVVQQFIPGRVLLEVWPRLGWWMRLRVAVTLRFYIRELRSISSRAGPPSFPGPLSDDGTPQKCTGRLFTKDGSGPFHSYRGMSRWYQNRLLVMQYLGREESSYNAPFDDNVPLVFTHMDLHPRNIILGDDGQLWILDWAEAGWYPSWFESASMTLFTQFRRDIPSSWTSWIPFIAGSSHKPGQVPFIRAITYSLFGMSNDIMDLIDPN